MINRFTNIRALSLCLIWALSFSAVSAQNWTVQEPEMPVLGLAGERILVRVQGPPGQKPLIGTPQGTEALRESSKGIYEGQVRLPAAGQKDLSLIRPDGSKQVIGAVQTSLAERYFVAQNETVSRQGPHADYDRLTPLYAGQKVALDGSRGNWLRCRESGTWLDGTGGQVKMGYLPPNRLTQVELKNAGNGDALLYLSGLRAGEVQVSHSVAKETLTIRLLDTFQTNFDIKRPTGVAEFLGPILLRPLTAPLAVEIEISCAAFSGYQIEPQAASNNLVIRVRKPLKPSLSGVRITVDAGHGGPKDSGAVGVGGLAEKELNLRVAKALAQKLKALGAIVTMTRLADSNVSTNSSDDGGELQARIDLSIKAGSQLFLSVHHNARPSIEESRVYHGTDIYWYQAHSQALAQSLADPIADAIGEKTRSFRWRSFYVIRQTHSPSVLMEFQYISNPNLEKNVLALDDYPEKAANGVVKGLVEYFKTRP